MTAISKLPPEIYPFIASHLPLQRLSPTLFSFVLTCRRIHSCIHPVLYSTIIIKNEDHASQMLDRILTDAKLGSLIREFHLRIDLSVEIKKRSGSNATVLSKLQQVIERGSLPLLNFFSLFLLRFKFTEAGWYEFGFSSKYELPSSFWENLRKCCPLLRGLCTHGVGCNLKTETGWEHNLVFPELKDFLGLSTFAFKCHHNHHFSINACSEKLFRSIVDLTSSLQSLTLSFKGYQLQDAGHILSLTFPHLKSISFAGIRLETSTTEEAMAFWRRHPNLERIHIDHGKSQWFSDEVEPRVLPNLTYLKAEFRAVRALATHLGQLEHLSISRSYNAQIPYLLRSVIPNGLPKLKSLEIHQEPYSSNNFILYIEGAMAHDKPIETENGEENPDEPPQNAWKRINNSYMRSIARGAPNLQEIYLDNVPPFRDPIVSGCPIFEDETQTRYQNQLAESIGRLKSLERFYYRAFDNNTRNHNVANAQFTKDCRLLGDLCHSLRTVTDVSLFENGPYLTGNIVRGGEGSVEDVVLGHGFGMESTGGDDDPFPLNKSSHLD